MIVYAVICRASDGTVLAEHSIDSSFSGNAPQVTIALIQHLKNNPEIVKDGDLKTYVHNNEDQDDFFSDFLNVCAMNFDLEEIEESYFHLYLKDGVYYCCISDDPDTRDQKVNFAFLQQIQTEFTKQNRARIIAKANAYGMDKSFSHNFRSTIHYYNVNQGKLRQDQKVTKLMAQVEDMKDVMGRNLVLSMRRAGNLERLAGISESLEVETQVFYKKSKVERKRRQRKYYRVYMTMVVLVLAIVYAILAAICGFSLNCKARFSG